MEKSEVLIKMKHVRNNFLIGLFLASNFPKIQHQDFVSKFMIERQGVEELILIPELVKNLQNVEFKKLALDQFIIMLLRSFQKETFEVIKDYCKRNKITHKMKEQPWYEFARIIRNCLSHDMKFKFLKYNIKNLPVNWRDKVIDQALEGITVPISLFGFINALELHDEIVAFATET